jgi:hypothetical protein
MGVLFSWFINKYKGWEGMGYLSPGLHISIRGGGGWGYRSPGLQISIRGWEDGVPLSWFTNKN